MSAPAVSVCVATFRRPDRLGRLLACLGENEAPPGGFEVVVVDDGSPVDDGVAGVLAEAGRELAAKGICMRSARQGRNRGPGAARNVAWRMAAGEWIAFTDDDCRPDRKWLVSLLDAARGKPAQVVVGRTVPDPDRVDLLGLPFSRSVAVDGMTGYFHTCNILYPRELLDRLGGFDEEFRLIGDDTDLGWRAQEAGASLSYCPAAIVVHDVVVGDWHSDLRSRRRWADVVRVIAKHPGARRLAWRPYVYRRSHLPILGIAVLMPALLAGRAGRVLFTGAVGVLLAGDMLRAGSIAGARAKMQGRVSDAYEVALLVEASWRQGALLL